MAKHKVKVFNSGDFPQGSYGEETLEGIFAKSEPVVAHFGHTKEGKPDYVPKELGTVSNFSVEGEEVFAEIDLNEEGEFLKENEFVEGISMELTKDSVSSVAILPTGVNPQVSDAMLSKFEETKVLVLGGIMRFEEETPKAEMSIPDLISFITDLDISTVSEAEIDLLDSAMYSKTSESYKVRNLQAAGYTITKTAVKFEEMKPEEVREAIKKEYETKSEGKIKFEEMKSQGKITKAMEDKGFNEKFISMLLFEKKNDSVLRFSEENFRFAEVILDVLEKLPALSLESEVKKGIKVDEGKESKEIDEMIEKTKQQVKAYQGIN